VKPVLLLLAAVLACHAQLGTHDELSAAQTEKRTNAWVRLDAGAASSFFAMILSLYFYDGRNIERESQAAGLPAEHCPG
jgi:hypothetical protein